MEVHVDVGHLLALQVQEALEDQAVLQRVDVGDAQAVEHHAGGGGAADPEQYLAVADEGDDVPDHQEVVGEAGVADDVQLVFQAFAGGPGCPRRSGGRSPPRRCGPGTGRRPRRGACRSGADGSGRSPGLRRSGGPAQGGWPGPPGTAPGAGG